MSKKDVKIRKKFPGDMDPSTKVHRVDTDYTRRSNKDAIKDALDEMENDQGDIDFGY